MLVSKTHCMSDVSIWNEHTCKPHINSTNSKENHLRLIIDQITLVLTVFGQRGVVLVLISNHGSGANRNRVNQRRIRFASANLSYMFQQLMHFSSGIKLVCFFGFILRRSRITGEWSSVVVVSSIRRVLHFVHGGMECGGVWRRC